MKRNSVTIWQYLAMAAVFVAGIASAQDNVTFGQQIAVLKMVKADLGVIGVMTTSLSEKDIASMTRSSLQQGVKLFVAQPKDAREIPALYKKLTSEKKAQLILIPSADDDLMLDIGYEYLRENTVLDKVGVCVPDSKFLSSGAFFFVGKENGKLVAYINQRVAVLVGASIPSAENSSITFVAR